MGGLPVHCHSEANPFMPLSKRREKGGEHEVNEECAIYVNTGLTS